MRWQGRRKSSNVEDRRGLRASGSRHMGGGSLMHLLPMVFRFLGFKGTAVLLVCVGAYRLFTGNLSGQLTGLGLQQGTPTSSSAVPFQETAEEKELVAFVSVILADTEETWKALFQEKGRTYQEPRLVLFREVTGFLQAKHNSLPSEKKMARSAHHTLIGPPTRYPLLP